MCTEFPFTADELALVQLLVRQDVESSRAELHHTDGFPYREHIKQRIERSSALLKKLDENLPTPADVVLAAGAPPDPSPALLAT